AEWRKTRDLIAGSYGYDKFGGACHMVPNHALVVHALLHGGGDFSRSLTIVNSCGWDTDCNSGNVGCILGIRNGLAAIDRSPVDWRGPIADRLYLATADGGRAISDAVRETYEVVNIGRALQRMPPLAPNGGARFHFEAPGSMQGFHAEGDGGRIQNVERQGGARNLALRYAGGNPVRAITPTFIPEEAIAMPGYTLLASPTLYPGQEVQAAVGAAPGNSEPVDARLLVRVYGPENRLTTVEGPSVSLAPGELQMLTWTVPGTFGAPIAEVGVEAAPAGDASGTLYLDYLTWSGTADTVFTRQADGGAMWKRAWVDGVDQVDQWEGRWPQPYRIVQNEGTGLISQGTADW
ncbi:MAG TPA: ADP-ribosylglycohydrolase family protein, partial [Thermomicrobiales bacterium]|nr:ADP-ribosylglycohydrolase family protein [Thermomicrobiales bacterium]